LREEPEAHTIWIAPSSEEITRARLRERETESNESLQRRFQQSYDEYAWMIAKKDKISVIITNDDFSLAVDHFLGFVLSRIHRLDGQI
jgi:guanylate kinase